MQFVSLANNHCLDYGQAGLLETQQALDEAGIAHAGRCCYLCSLACASSNLPSTYLVPAPARQARAVLLANSSACCNGL